MVAKKKKFGQMKNGELKRAKKRAILNRKAKANKKPPIRFNGRTRVA